MESPSVQFILFNIQLICMSSNRVRKIIVNLKTNFNPFTVTIGGTRKTSSPALPHPPWTESDFLSDTNSRQFIPPFHSFVIHSVPFVSWGAVSIVVKYYNNDDDVVTNETRALSWRKFHFDLLESFFSLMGTHSFPWWSLDHFVVAVIDVGIMNSDNLPFRSSENWIPQELSVSPLGR